MVAALAGVEARRRTEVAIPAGQVIAGQGYAFAYDPATIAELDAVATCHIAGQACDE
jgi:hypothetical protein